MSEGKKYKFCEYLAKKHDWKSEKLEECKRNTDKARKKRKDVVI